MGAQTSKTRRLFPSIFGTVALLLSAPAARADEPVFTDSFMLSHCTFSTTGSNAYFVLEPGYFQVLEGEDAGDRVMVRITVLHETVEIRGIAARVVEERETRNGELTEVSRNYFVFCNETKSVFCAGESVDFYEDGVVVGHEGTWLAGAAGARGGLQMPGLPLVGARYYQENAPGVAQDRAEIVSVSGTVDTPAGRFVRCVVVHESMEEAPDGDDKIYAPGVGIVKDGNLVLTGYGYE